MTSSARTTIARFVNVRGAQRAEDTGLAAIKQIRPPKGFKSELEAAVEKGDVKYRDDMREKAAKTIANIGDDLAAIPLERSVRAALMVPGVTVSAASDAIKTALGSTPAQLIADHLYLKRLHATWEQLYAQSVLGQDRRATIAVLRASAALDRLAASQGTAKADPWSQVLTWRAIVPKSLFLPDRPNTPKPDPAVKAMLDLASALHHELEILERIEAKAEDEDSRYYRFGDGAKTRIETINSLREGLRKPDDIRGRAVTDEDVQDIDETMVEPENWLLKEVAKTPQKSIFTADEQKFLRRHQSLMIRESERDAVVAMRDDLYQRTRALLPGSKHALPTEVLSDQKVKSLTGRLRLPFRDLLGKGSFPAPPAIDLPRVHMLGIGDLIVVEERLNRYELGEIAHVENVMAKETRGRRHIRIAETETTLSTESEETAVDEKSLQTTDRFELAKEIESQLEVSLELSAGSSVAAAYGPVSVSANVGMEASTSASTGVKTASVLAREAVEKAVTSVTKRVREEQIIRVLNRVEETNEHGFVNDTTQNLSGIYRWIDKFYTVRAVNYGRRLMLEMIVPEPANGFLYARDMHADEEPIAPPPPPISFGPKDITRSNYLDYARIYGATDVPPPPPEIVHRTLTFGKASDGNNQNFVESGQSIAIPEGYQTTNIWKASRVYYKGSYKSSYIAGNKMFPSDNSALPGVTGALQVSASVECVAFHIGWNVRCELMPEAFQAWTVAAWASIKQAYDASVSAYEEKLAAQAIGRGVHVHGLNPGQNKTIMRNELKRAAIKYLSDDMAEIVVAGITRRNEVFNAADSTGDFNLREARLEGMIIQFFEQAFEWNNMTWLFYPYFWADSARHHQKMLAEDSDPAMREFLSAGAARIVVPVPVDYEDAVLNFFETNEIWNGGEPPLVDNPDYVSIAEELKQGRTNSFSMPIHYESAATPPPFIIDEWEVKLLTSLVKLQEDGSLPVFPTGLFETDAVRLLDAKAQSTSSGANWRNSIVDLLTLFGLANAGSESVRRTFAEQNGYPGNPGTDPIVSIDNWCYIHVMGQISLNGLS